MHDSGSKKAILLRTGLLYLSVVAGIIVCMAIDKAGYTPVVLLVGAFIGSILKILPPERYASTSIPRSVIEGVFISVVILLPFTALLYGLKSAGILSFSPGIPAKEGLIRLLLIHVIAIAIPEEYFFRGTIQPALDRIWTPRWRIFGIPFGLSLFVTSLLFGIAHVFRQGPIGLTTAIPSLAFGLFYYRHRNITGAVIFHAACNLLMVFLQVDYRQLLRYFGQNLGQ